MVFVFYTKKFCVLCAKQQLYEQLIIRKADPDDKFRDNRTANLMALMERYGAGKMNVIPENEDETVRIQI